MYNHIRHLLVTYSAFLLVLFCCTNPESWTCSGHRLSWQSTYCISLYCIKSEISSNQLGEDFCLILDCKRRCRRITYYCHCIAVLVSYCMAVVFIHSIAVLLSSSIIVLFTHCMLVFSHSMVALFS